MIFTFSSFQVLVIVDGSPENIVLLELLSFSLSEATYKRLHLSPVTLFVDELFLCADLTDTQRQAHLKQAYKLASNYNFKPYYLSLADDEERDFVDDIQISAKEKSFIEAFNSIKSLTSRQEYLHQLKVKRIRQIAQKLNCHYIFTAEISQQLAKTFLSNIALGRGSSVAQDLSFADDRDEVQIIRPIRDLNINEINNYISLNGLPCLPTYGYGLTAGTHSSLQNLTSKFVEDLQKDFSSTVSTVYRTGDKIAAKKYEPEQMEDQIKSLKLDVDEKCLFCKSTLDYHSSSTLFAIEYSRLVSANSSATNNQLEQIVRLEEQARQAVEGVAGNEDKDDRDVAILKKRLCHGCRNIFQDMNGDNILQNSCF
jgi:cytoplasmic tRNA 2-thiolation protein 2